MIIVKLVGAKEISLYVVSNIGKKNCSPRAEDQLRVIQKKKRNTSGAEMGEIIRWSGLCNISVCSSSIFLNRGTLLSISKL